MENSKSKEKRKFNKAFVIAVIVLLLVAVALMGLWRGYNAAKNDSPTYLNSVSVVDFVENDQLNTFRTNYQDVVTVYDEKKTDKVDYYVSYDAVVDVGINFSEINIKQDNKERTITVNVPEAAIQDINVDITSLEFLFYDKKADNEDVVNNAYKICNEAAEAEIGKKEKIIELANENVKNLVNAYIQPFMELTNNEFQVRYIIGGQDGSNGND